jgi:hypothetical protein
MNTLLKSDDWAENLNFSVEDPPLSIDYTTFQAIELFFN